MVARVPMPRPESSPDLFGTLQREVNRVFDQMFGAAAPTSLGAFAPSVEMQETGQGVAITAELPGMEEKDVEITLDGDLLTVTLPRPPEALASTRRIPIEGAGSAA